MVCPSCVFCSSKLLPQIFWPLFISSLLPPTSSLLLPQFVLFFVFKSSLKPFIFSHKFAYMCFLYLFFKRRSWREEWLLFFSFPLSTVSPSLLWLTGFSLFFLLLSLTCSCLFYLVISSFVFLILGHNFSLFTYVYFIL